MKKRSIRYFMITASIILLIDSSFAQKTKVDSLEKFLCQTILQDTTRVDAENNLSRAYLKISPEKMEEHARKALALASEINYNKGIGNAYNNLGVLDWQKSNNAIAREEFEKALAVFQKTADKVGMAKCYGNIGLIYKSEGNFKDALNYQLKSLKVREELKDEDGMAKNYSAIGNIYNSEKNFAMSLDYHQKAQELWTKLNNKTGVATCLINIGNLYVDQQNDSLALANYLKALNLVEKLDDNVGLSTCCMNIAMIYDGQGKTEEAMDYYRRALAIKEQLGDQSGISICYLNMGGTLLHQKKYDEAIVSLNKALALCLKINRKEGVKNVYGSLAQVYADMNNYKQAYYYHELYTKMKDTLFSEGSAKDMAEMQTKYESEKKQREIELLTKDGEIQSLQLNKTHMWMYLLGALVLLVFSFTGLFYNRYKLKLKANLVLEHRNNEITQQKKEITDSINYAKRIQESILPPMDTWNRMLPDSFIFYRPKDIVSGDFYWIEQKNDIVCFAAVDCTGHGVPGALMSVIGFNLLTQSINEVNLTKPSDILRHLDAGVTKTLRQSQEGKGVKDGMDLSLCSLNTTTLELQYAGAYNSLYYTSNGEMLEVKADKFPIGVNLDGIVDNYTNHSIQLKRGDCIYLYSDGYADQFGGPKGKKFKYNKLKDLLIACSKLPVHQQRATIEKAFDDWKGDLEQVDDVVIIGVRV